MWADFSFKDKIRIILNLLVLPILASIVLYATLPQNLRFVSYIAFASGVVSFVVWLVLSKRRQE